MCRHARLPLRDTIVCYELPNRYYQCLSLGRGDANTLICVAPVRPLWPAGRTQQCVGMHFLKRTSGVEDRFPYLMWGIILPHRAMTGGEYSGHPWAEKGGEKTNPPCAVSNGRKDTPRGDFRVSCLNELSNQSERARTADEHATISRISNEATAESTRLMIENQASRPAVIMMICIFELFSDRS